jgi:hypothetical protein
MVRPPRESVRVTITTAVESLIVLYFFFSFRRVLCESGECVRDANEFESDASDVF